MSKAAPKTNILHAAEDIDGVIEAIKSGQSTDHNVIMSLKEIKRTILHSAEYAEAKKAPAETPAAEAAKA